MAMVDTPSFEWPSTESVPAATASSFGFSNVLFDSGTDRLAWVGQATKALTLDSVLFRTTTVTTGSTLEIRIETVADGRPTGTLFSATTNGTVVVADSDDNVWKTVVLTAAASISAGAFFAIVIINSSGTPSINFASWTSATIGFTGSNFPIVLQDTGAGTWGQIARAMVWAVESSGVPTRLPSLLPFAISNGTINTGTTPDEIAAKFTMPFKCRVRGAVLSLSNIAAAADYRVFLWDSVGDTEAEALADLAVDGDHTPSTAADGSMSFYFATPVTLSAASTYYLGVRAETANSLIVVRANTGETGAPADLYKAMPSGADFIQASRTWSAINPGTTGAWTDDSTLSPLFRLIIDQLDDGAGGGSRARINGLL